MRFNTVSDNNSTAGSQRNTFVRNTVNIFCSWQSQLTSDHSNFITGPSAVSTASAFDLGYCHVQAAPPSESAKIIVKRHSMARFYFSLNHQYFLKFKIA